MAAKKKTRHGATQPEAARTRKQALLRLDERAMRDLAALAAELRCPKSHAVAAALHVMRQALTKGEDGALDGYEDRLTDYYEAAEAART